MINISHFTSTDDYKKRVNEVINNIKNSKTRRNVEEIFIPGEPEELNKKKRLADGIFISETTWNSIGNIAREYGLNVTDWVNVE